MIHPSALIDADAVLADDVSVGPFTIIGPGVEVGAGTVIGPHVVLKGPTRIGRNNRIYQFSSVGEDCQDKKYAGEPTRLEIGDRNVIREFVTIHRGTIQDKGVTSIGNDNLLMAYTHVAHDCVVGNGCIMANAASLAGHVHVNDHAILGGFTLVHQFCKIGKYSFSAMGSVVSRDIPPYVIVGGSPTEPHASIPSAWNGAASAATPSAKSAALQDHLQEQPQARRSHRLAGRHGDPYSGAGLYG